MAELKHVKCGGIISIDMADMFTLRTHSIMVTPTELKLGVVELSPSRSRSNHPKFLCTECDKKFAMKEEEMENIAAMCLVCVRQKPVTELYVSMRFPCICKECKDAVSGEGGKDAEIAKYFDMSLSDTVFTPFVDILKKPVS
jgi:hypothetical protein